MNIPKTMTLNQAAKVSGRSKATISKALKQGRLSYVAKDSDGYQIDPSELNRVFPVNMDKVNSLSHREPQGEHPQTLSKTLELELLLKSSEQEKLIYQNQLREKDITIEDYRSRLTKAEDVISRQTFIIADNTLKKPLEEPKENSATLPSNSLTHTLKSHLWLFVAIFLTVIMFLGLAYYFTR